MKALLCIVVLSAMLLASNAAPVPRDLTDAEAEADRIENNQQRLVTPLPDDRRRRSEKANPPVLNNKEPSPVSIQETATGVLELDCTAKSRSRYKVVWFKNGERLTRDSPRRMSTYQFTRKGELKMKKLHKDDEGVYTCEVTNKFGTVSKTFDVSVHYRVAAIPPIITAGEPGNHTVIKDSPLTMKCSNVIDDPGQPYAIRWYYHAIDNVTGTDRDPEGKLRLELLQECTSQGMCSLGDDQEPYYVENAEEFIIDKVQSRDGGWYTCVIENEMGTKHSSGFVKVLDEAPADPNVAVAKAQFGAIAAVVIALCFVLGVSIFCWKKVKKERAQKKMATETWNKVYEWTKVVLVEKQEAEAGGVGQPLLAPKVTIEKKKAEHTGSALSTQMECEYEFLSSDPSWEIDRAAMTMTTTLGEGAFGRVRLAETIDPSLPKLVAVKMLKDNHSDQDMIDLVKEMEIMKVMGSHPNIINLLGVCTQPRGQSLYLVVEFAKNGNLKEFLRSKRPAPLTPSSPGGTPSPTSAFYETPSVRRFDFEGPPPPYPGRSDYEPREQDDGSQLLHGLPLKDMLDMAYQVSEGMKFLASKRCVHRDLAARNVLITENMELKIADFGMARDLQDSDYYRKFTGGRVPLKWMAPEAIFERLYTAQSDVWSFGVLMWEIVTLGDSPFRNVASDVFTEHLRIGRTLPQPTNCPGNVYETMRSCWRMDPKERPVWTDLAETLKRLHADAAPNVYLELTHMPSPPVSPGYR